MKPLRDLLDKLHPLFTKGGKLERLYPLYEAADTSDGGWLSVYVGYYNQQRRGKTIHSPKNCLPGSGWEALASTTMEIESSVGPVTVNRYLLQRDNDQAVVLYWYQGRGRIQANEYAVKLDLLRDAALQRRSDEALVRLVIPIRRDEAAAHELGLKLAATVAPMVENALPGSDA